MAAAHGNSYTMKSILRTGVDANATDGNGWSSVHYSAFHGRLGCLQLLQKWGAHLDECDQDGNTAAHLAAQEGHLPCFKFLISCGPSVTHVLAAHSDNGLTPKDLAHMFCKDNIVAYIDNLEYERDHPEETDNLAFPAHSAAYTGDLDSLIELIEQGVVSINERDNKGATAAHKAAGNGQVKCLHWLIENGANVTLKNDAGETAKDVARRFAQLACAKLLGDCINEVDSSDKEQCSTASKTLTPEGNYVEHNPVEAKARALSRISECEAQLASAKLNYEQLGGKSPVMNGLMQSPESRTDRLNSSIAELQSQLAYERLKREKLEAQLMQYKREIVHLNKKFQQADSAGTLSTSEDNTRDSDGHHFSHRKTELKQNPSTVNNYRQRRKDHSIGSESKKPPRPPSRENGILIQRNVSVPRPKPRYSLR